MNRLGQNGKMSQNENLGNREGFRHVFRLRPWLMQVREARAPGPPWEAGAGLAAWQWD